MTARILTAPELPIFEKYPGYTFWGVIRDLNTGWRIFIHQLPNGTFVMLSFYKKQKGKAPKHEIEKAEARAKEVAKLHRYR
ncbi:MAG: type II toxin-antitoxin system RelE/ParE family toxin [Chitinophagaceae bacterium]|nr:type II toxin-antitoxin system RelE/ParE family toxin [Chitinophagaceae bacterium]